MSASDSRPFRLMMVEDNPDDQELARVALRRIEREVSTEFQHDGRAALDRLVELAAPASGAKAELPDVVLLDLNTPRLDGVSMLRELRQHPMLGDLPVVVFTTSTAERDVRAAHEAGCNAFLVKPYSMGDLTRVLDGVIAFWSSCVRPTR